MSSLPHTFAALSTSPTRRTFLSCVKASLQSLIFLPLVSSSPLPLPPSGQAPPGSSGQAWSGTVAFNCDAGESALIEWYVAGIGTIYADWIFLNRFAELDLRRDIAPTRGGLPMVGWFLPTAGEQLLRVRWACTIPSWVSWASCII